MGTNIFLSDTVTSDDVGEGDGCNLWTTDSPVLEQKEENFA